MKKIIFTFFTLLLLSDLVAQQSFCGTSDNFPNALSGISSARFTEISRYLVRIVFHVIRSKDGRRGITEAQVNQALQRLSTDFNPHNICFSLVRVNYINNDDFVEFGDGCPGSPPTGTGANDDNDYEEIIAMHGVSNAINIVILPDNQFFKGLSVGTPGTGIIIGGTQIHNKVSTVLSTSKALSHEMGHCLGLFHTFRGTCTCEQNVNNTCIPFKITDACAELVDGSNGTTCGDFVRDTPADPILLNSQNLGSACVWNNTNMRDAKKQLYRPDATNIMAYTYPQCMQSFSIGQGERMRGHLATSTVLRQVVVQDNTFVQNRQINTGSLLFASLNSITAGSSVTTGTQGSVSFTNITRSEFRTKSYIELKPGFNAQAAIGGVFFTTLNSEFCSIITQNNSARMAPIGYAYHPFLDNNAKWLSTLQGIEGFQNSRYKISGDTIVNKISYKKIEEQFVEIEGMNTTPSKTGRGEILLLREDIGTKTVYRLYPNNDDETMIYDFNLNIGQKLTWNDKYSVLSIDSIKVVDGMRKRITFTAKNESPIIWIEGVGNISNPFISDAIVQPSQKLICSYQNNRIIYDEGKVFNIDCTALTTATSESKLSRNQILIYPNPITDNLNISSPYLSKADIFIIDLLGKTVITEFDKDLSSLYTLNIANLQSGIYIVLVKSNLGISTHKIQKK